ncbi:MAG: patatin-like phospholipase family protein [Ideonella sp.]|nr:patatin-like phospholipase family protein [Ideonella sp.]MCC7455794.1 patatin-like phospholipase family protein [Nitrospira sp.]
MSNPHDPAPAAGAHAPEFRILAVSGGGFLGLYAASVLAQLEEQAGEPLARRFDLVAGTSVGAVIASSLACEVPMRDVVELFQRHGAEVFSPRQLPGGPVSRLIDLSRSVLGPKYSGAALRRALEARLGRRTLADTLHPLVLPAVNVTRCTSKVFKSPHARGSRGDEHVSLVDATLASCAAPAYFPSVAIGGQLYADGGLFAVAPDQVALHEAQHFMGVEASRVRMVSVGTATAGYQPVGGIDDDAGAVGWLSGGRLILTLIAVQQQHLQAMMEDRLGARYLRLDAVWPPDAGLGVDVATAHAAEVLLSLARQTLAQTPRARLRAFTAARD